MLELAAFSIGTVVGIAYKKYSLAALSFLLWVALIAHKGGML